MINPEPKKLLIIVPCFNEALRLNPKAFEEALHTEPQLEWLFVNDGSTDQTQTIISELCLKNPKRIHTLCLENNKGKAEAVRQGLLWVINKKYSYFGYFDADLATPISELLRLYKIFTEIPNRAIIGVRLLLQGRQVERSLIRYGLGRTFNFIAALLLNQKLSDTQCGAKLFKYSSLWELSVQKPFVSRWLFDVELLSRLKKLSSHSNSDFFEEPLRLWKEVGGSKVKWHSFLTAIFDLVKILFYRY